MAVLRRVVSVSRSRAAAANVERSVTILGWDLSLVPYLALTWALGCLFGWWARELRDWLAKREP